MSSKKKVVVSTGKSKSSEKPSPTTSRIKGGGTSKSGEASAMTFGRINYMYMLGGVALIIVGMLLMAGGGMPSPDVWDESIIYSFRRITLAPIFILAGLVLEVVGIFK
jgi:hypothetical protein